MTASNDNTGREFQYDTKAEQEQAYREEARKQGLSEQEIAEDLKGLSDKPNIFDGRTLSADESPSGNIRVIIADGTGRTSDEPNVRFAMTTAHELYGHAFLAQQGKPFKHDDGGPVDARIYKVIEPRTEKLYQQKPQQQLKPQKNKP